MVRLSAMTEKLPAPSAEIMRQNLLVIAQTFATASRLSLTTVSKQIHGSGEFFAGYAAGEVSCGVDTYFAMVNRFRLRWPDLAEKTPWPKTSPMGKLGKNVHGTSRP